MNDSDGGSGAPAPSSAGPQTLRVEPAAIPGARDAFAAAHKDISDLVTQLNGLIVQPWANDPVSQETAQRFANRSNGGDAQAALEALRKYGEQLEKSATALDSAYKAYVRTEGANTAKWKGQPTTA